MKSFNPKHNKGEQRNGGKYHTSNDKRERSSGGERDRSFGEKRDRTFSDKGKPFEKRKSPFKEERTPNIFDRAFQDPDKARKQRERDELIGPVEEKVFSKSLDDVENPKYGSQRFGNKSANHSDNKGDRKSFDRSSGKFNKGEKKSYDRSDSKFGKGDRNSNDRSEAKFEKGERKSFDSKRSNQFLNSKDPKDRQGSYRSETNKGDRRNDYRNERNEDRRSERKEDRRNGGANREVDKYTKDNRKPNDRSKGKTKQFEKFMKPAKEEKDGLENYKFKSRFTSFDEEHKAYASKGIKNTKNKFEGKDASLDNTIQQDYNPNAKMPLNKYLSRSGLCSRRDAVEIVKEGKVTVNGTVINEPGYKVQENDIVKLNNKRVQLNKEYIYVLLNKPKGYITTLDDPKGRRIISELYEDEISERIFPVGRLDRNTTGLILLTNDGDLSNQLAHPKYVIKKIYQVKLDKPVTQPHMNQILNGLELEDGIAEVDQLSYLAAKDEIGIEIHSGKNRIVRRIFEHLGYEVEKLDRVLYAGLTKKNLPKGKWRFLSRQEVINLKHLGKKKSEI